MGAAGLPNSMNLKKYTFSIFVLFPLAGLWKGGPSTPVGGLANRISIQNHVVPSQNFLPDLTPTVDDLDARDAQNRSISDDETRSSLRKLFLENLFRLSVVEPTHAWREAAEALDALSRRFHDAFSVVSRALQQLFQALLRSPLRRVVHNVNKLWISISVGVYLTFFLSANIRFQNVPQSLSLRC